MTQDVQPLTWQKRTNIEEHMQFFTKINEIVSALESTVEQAEAAVVAATAASAAAQQASDTVAGYASRLTAAEGRITTLDGQAVKITGTQTISGVKTVPTEATGTSSQQIANSAKVKNELDNYAPMVRTTDNQVIAGIKEFTGLIRPVGNSQVRTELQNNSVKRSEPTTTDRSFDIRFTDVDGNNVGVIQFICSNTSRYFRLGIFNLSGNVTWTTLANVTL